MRTIRYALALLLIGLGTYAAFIVFSKSVLAGVIVGLLTLAVVIPILLDGRARARNRAQVGEDPSSKLGVGVRQARAIALREEGEILGAPPPRG